MSTAIQTPKDAMNVNEGQIAIQLEILDELLRDEFGSQPEFTNCGGLDVLWAPYAIHDIDSILGLNAMPALVGLTCCARVDRHALYRFGA